MSRPHFIAWRRIALRCASLLLMFAPLFVSAQELQFQTPATPNDAATAAAMRDLAARVLPVYEERDTDRFLERLSIIQAVAGDYAPARSSRQSLRTRRPADATADADGQGAGIARLLDITIHALALQRDSGRPFEQTFGDAFREAITPLSDLQAFAITGWRAPPLRELEQELQQDFDRQRGRSTIALADAVDLLRGYFLFDAQRRFAAPLRALASEDERRRYVFESVRVPAANGVQLQAQVVRPKDSTRAAPALLEFTIHHDSTQSAAAPAAHGYAGVIAFTRATQNPPALALPFEFDGEDAVAVIAWIAQQPWNDGNVAMIGEGYSGFTAWAAAARAPPALKAIATADPMAPGIDMPMSGNIFHNEAYRWAQRVTGRSDGQAKPGDDGAAWAALDRAWFTSGRRYRDLDNLNGARNPFFERWLNHPSYDRYWQKMIPFREGFAQVRIPALTVTGYYSANQSGALYYFDQHLRYLPSADHRLLVGPYVQGGGEPAESAAQLDLTQLRYQWLDHVFKGTQRPAPLEDRVNFITQGVDQWRHADSLRTMSNGVLRFYLDAQITAGGHLLAQRETPNDTFVSTQLSMRDRSETNTATTYISAPLAAPTDLAGEIRGRIELLTNKQDVDLTLAIYELRANGEFVMLFDPAITFRASYAADRVRRRLLKAGRRQQIEFRSERLMSRRLAAGSRLMLVLGVNKRPDQQINYGAGNDVSEESIADARTPMRLRWYGGSYVELPIREP